MGMKIVAGLARNIELETPRGTAVRPTAGRSRKALFDSLGARFQGSRVLDLFAGSGALGLEAASRGAAAVFLAEREAAHLRIIERNIERVKRTGVTAEFTLLPGAVNAALPKRLSLAPELIFADPPYPESAELYHLVIDAFRRAWPGALLIWELPDLPGAAGAFLGETPRPSQRVRDFGGTLFLQEELTP